MPQTNEYRWTTGNDPELEHQERIAVSIYSEVHKMVRTRTSQQVFARKFIRPFGLWTAEDILEEVHAIHRLFAAGTHENLVKVLGHGWLSDSSYYYIDMEYCQGNLEDYIKGKLSLYPQRLDIVFPRPPASQCEGAIVAKLYDIMEQIASGLEFIHSHKQVHRDVKPANVLFSSRNKSWKLCDFGLTSEGTSKRMKATANGSGTPSYRPPELLTEFPSYNQKVDIFALGCILFELASKGKKAFANDYAVIEYRGLGTNVTIPSTPHIKEYWRKRLSTLIFQMLAVEAAHRPSVQFLRHRFTHERSLAVGEAYLKGGQLSLAISAFHEAIQNNVADGQTWRNLGNAYREMGKYSDAIEWFQKATYLTPRDPALVLDLGNTYLSCSEYNHAIEIFQKVCKADPKNPHLLERLGTAYYLGGDHNKAKALYTAARALDPKIPIIHEEALKDSKLSKPSEEDKRGLQGWKTISTLFKKKRAPSIDDSIQGAEQPAEASSNDTVNPSALTCIYEVLDTNSQLRLRAKDLVVALHTYSARGGKKMRFTSGDIVLLEEVYEEGWARGFKLSLSASTQLAGEEGDETIYISGSSKRGNQVVRISRRRWTGLLQAIQATNDSSPEASRYFLLSDFCHYLAWEEVMV